MGIGFSAFLDLQAKESALVDTHGFCRFEIARLSDFAKPLGVNRGEVLSDPSLEEAVLSLNEGEELPLLFDLRRYPKSSLSKLKDWSFQDHLSRIRVRREGRKFYLVYDKVRDALSLNRLRVRTSQYTQALGSIDKRLFLPNEEIEFVDFGFKFTLPSGPKAQADSRISASWKANQFLNAAVFQILAHQEAHKLWPHSQKTYMQFLEVLGWNTRSFEYSPLDVQKLKALYQQHFEPFIQEGVIRREDVLVPGLVLTDGIALHVQPIWDPVPAHLQIPADGYLDEKAERVLSANGYFSFTLGPVFTPHDLFGHISAFFEHPLFMAEMHRAAALMMPRHVSGLEVLAGKHLKIDVSQLPEMDRLQLGRYSVMSELLVGALPGAKEEFKKITWFDSDQTDLKAFERILKEKSVAELLHHGDQLIKFYYEYLRPLGGAYRDRVLGQELMDPGRLYQPLAKVLSGDLAERPDLLLSLALLDQEQARESVKALRVLILNLELELGLWASASPQEFMSFIHQKGDSQLLEEGRRRGILLNLDETGGGAWYWFAHPHESAGRRQHMAFWRLQIQLSQNPGRLEDIARLLKSFGLLDEMIPNLINKFSELLWSRDVLDWLEERISAIEELSPELAFRLRIILKERR